MKNIVISFVPHEDQPYDTLGDYREFEHNLSYQVSKELPEEYQFLVMIHELIESYLCKKDGVKWKDIDAFDEEYENIRSYMKAAGSRSHKYPGHKSIVTNDSEPGDEPTAPYFKQHQFASAIERLLCDKLGITWAEYERECARILNEVVDHRDRH